MFQYTKEVIINDQPFEAKTVNGVPHFLVRGAGNFVKGTVLNMIKVAAKDGAVAELTLPTTAASAQCDTTRYRVIIKLKNGCVDATIANSFTYFIKNLCVEVGSGATVDAIKSAFKLAFPDNTDIPVYLNSTNTKLIAKSEYIDLQLVTEELKYVTGYKGEMEVTKTTTGAVVSGTLPFGTYAELIKNNRIPTYENIRFGGMDLDERLVPGQKYDLYELKLITESTSGGYHVVGQRAESITTCRFWVRVDRSTEFATAVDTIIDKPEVA